MRAILKIERYITTQSLYVGVGTTILNNTQIVFPNLIAEVNSLLTNLNKPYYVTNGVTMADGWSYFVCAANPAPVQPVVSLPTNNIVLPPVDSIPGNYELRVRTDTSF